MSLDVVPSSKYVFSDLPEPDAIAWTRKLGKHSHVSFDGKLTYPAYRYIPITYLICENDKTLPRDFQESMVELASKECPWEADILRCSAGHVPNVTQPESVIRAIRRACGEKV